MRKICRIGLLQMMLAATTSTIALSSSLADQGEKVDGFQGWVKTYCGGQQTEDAILFEYGTCSMDDAYYQLAAPGVRYKTLREGSGRAASKGDGVVVEYLGWLYDKEAAYARGTIIDTSYTIRNGPFLFVLGESRVIPGWETGIQGMKRGEVRELIIAPNMAYGDRAIGNRIPPSSTLIFEIELLELSIAE